MATPALPTPQGMVSVRIVVFGGLRVFVDGAEVDAGPPRQRVILAMLVAGQGRVVTLAEMLEGLWGDAAPASAINQIHRHVGNLRRLLQPELPPRSSGNLILAAGNGYRLEATSLASDLLRFGELRGEPSPSNDGQQRADASTEALAIAAQPAFPGLPDELRSKPLFAVIDSERKAAAIHACDTVADPDRRLAMLPHVESIAFEHPLDEVLHARLISLLAGLGRRSDAIAHFEATRDALRNELGLSPGPELRSAYLALLQDDGEAPDDATDQEESDAHHELPPPLSSFIPREDVQHILDSVVDTAVSKGAIAILSGMGGLGKTTLAVHWARSLASRFKHGELYINLLGYEPNREPLTTDEAMSRLLEQLGSVPAETSAARTAQYRSMVSDRSLVILLDNARDSEQVRPLLTSTPGCLTIVTSRDRLSGLVVREGARSVPLRRWNASESRELLATRLGTDRMTLDADAIDSIVESCAGLPLALAIAAARSALEPESSIPELAAQLADRANVLDLLQVGESDDLRSAFEWSYRALPEEAARMFRHLAAHPGPQISINSLAACAGRSVGHTREQIDALLAASMATDAGSEMVSLHDLLRAYANDLIDDAGERDGAERRLIDHYIRSNRQAFLQFGREPTVALPDGGPDEDSIEHFTSAGETFNWYSREREPLRWCVTTAVDRGLDLQAALITLDWRPMNQTIDSAADSITACRIAFDAALRTGNQTLIAELARDLGSKHSRLGQFDEADELINRSLVSFKELGDLTGESNAYRNLSQNAGKRHDLASQTRYSQDAVAAARRSGRADILALALIELGQTYENAKDFLSARPAFLEARDNARSAGLIYPLPIIETSLAIAYYELGKFPEAERWAIRALATLRAEPDEDIYVLSSLLSVTSEIAMQMNDPATAREALDELDILLRDPTLASEAFDRSTDDRSASVQAVRAWLANQG